MTTQLTIADALTRAELEEQARDRGMTLAASHNGDLLHLARGLAYMHAREHGTVSIEDVRRELDRRIPGWDMGGPTSKNWMGSIFRGDRRFVRTGNDVPANHKGGHARAVREWRLK